MATISKPNTFSAGATIVASEHNDNFDTIYDDYNGNITNANISDSAAISDTKFAQIATPSKVNLSALVISSQAAGDLIYASSASALTRLAAGTSGNFLQSAGTAAPAWANKLSSSSMLPAGAIIQVVGTSYSASVSGTVTIPNDDSIPQITEGNEVMSLAITPGHTSNQLLVSCSAFVNLAAAAQTVIALFNTDVHTGNALFVTNGQTQAGADEYGSLSFEYLLNAPVTSSTTFTVRGGGSSGAFGLNSNPAGSRKYGAVAKSSLIIKEIKGTQA